MSMSTTVYGVKPPDERWRQMKAVWDACELAKVAHPQEVVDYFEGEPDDDGEIMEITEHEAVTHYTRCGVAGWDIELALLPKSFTRIRFENSW